MILLIATLQRNIATQWNTGVVRMIIEPVTIRTIRTTVFAHLSARHTKNKRRIKSSDIIYHISYTLLFVILIILIPPPFLQRKKRLVFCHNCHADFVLCIPYGENFLSKVWNFSHFFLSLQYLLPSAENTRAVRELAL